jgi:hypothetical protein
MSHPVKDQQIDINLPGTVADVPVAPSKLSLDLLACLEEMVGFKPRCNSDTGIEEVALLQNQADRLGLVYR